MSRGDSVFFLHGFWGAPDDFRFVRAANLGFHPEFVAYVQDPELGPHHFLSDWGAQFLKWVQTRSPGRPLKAVGYSQGGRLLLQALQQSPESFEKLLLISVNPGLQSFPEREERLHSDRRWAQDFRTRPWKELESRWNAQSVFAGGKSSSHLHKDEDRESLALCLENWSLAHQPDFRDLMNQHAKKIEVLIGESDTKYVEQYKFFKGPVTKAKGAAHRVPLDKPSLVVEKLKSIIS
ncbi:MAG: alpha/beta fold hydrolase [Bdellovibrionales bacterium]